MDARLQRRVQRYGWDLAMERYEDGWREPLAPAHERLLERAALRPGERVLDVACGTGLVALEAARRVGPAGAVLAVDLSGAMVRRTAELAASAGLAHLEARRMDAEALELESASFDAVLVALGLMYAPDPARALAEVRRVLRGRGRSVLAVWGERRRCGWAEIFPIVDRRVRSEVCPLFFQLGTGDSLERALRAAGFVDVRSSRLETKLRYPSARAALAAAFDAGPVALAASRFDAETQRAAEREYLASLEPFQEGAGYAIPGEFVVAEGLAST